MWQAALATYDDPETNYLFYPEKVVAESFEKVQADLLKHKLSLQRNKHTQIWTTISQTLHEFYNDDPTQILGEGNMDVSQIVQNLRVVNKKRFPYLSGPKMANYWLYILHHFTDVKLSNLGQLSIIPDTHVIQSSQVLGLTDKEETPDEIARLWFELLEGSDLIPIDLHPILWNWSRAGFKPEVSDL